MEKVQPSAKENQSNINGKVRTNIENYSDIYLIYYTEIREGKKLWPRKKPRAGRNPTKESERAPKPLVALEMASTSANEVVVKVSLLQFLFTREDGRL